MEKSELKREEVIGAGVLRKLHNEKHHDLYFPQYIIRAIRGKRMRWSWHVAYIWGEGKCIQGFVGVA